MSTRYQVKVHSAWHDLWDRPDGWISVDPTKYDKRKSHKLNLECVELLLLLRSSIAVDWYCLLAGRSRDGSFLEDHTPDYHILNIFPADSGSLHTPKETWARRQRGGASSKNCMLGKSIYRPLKVYAWMLCWWEKECPYLEEVPMLKWFKCLLISSSLDEHTYGSLRKKSKNGAEWD